MKVILRTDVEKLGLRGEVVEVARGYARNFLLPRRLAEPATDSRVAEIERVAAQRARHEAQTFEQAQDMARRLEGDELRLDVKAGEKGVLFGSVTATDLTDAFWERLKIRVDRRKIDLAEPIKRIGRYRVPVALFDEVTVEVKVAVVPEGGELPPEEELEAMEAEAAAEAAAAEEEAQARGAEAEAAIEAVLEEEEASPEAEEPAQEPAEASAEPAEVEPEPAPEGEAAPEPEPEAHAEPEPAPEVEAAPDPEPEPEADSEPEQGLPAEESQERA